MVDRFKRFSFSVFEISRCWHKLAADVMARYDLKGPYAMYLVVLLDNPEGLTAAQLCELCGRDKADVSRGVSAMLSKGLISRESGNTSTFRAPSFRTTRACGCNPRRGLRRRWHQSRRRMRATRRV